MAYVSAAGASYAFLQWPPRNLSSFAAICLDVRMLHNEGYGALYVIGNHPAQGEPLLASMIGSESGTDYWAVNYVSGATQHATSPLLDEAIEFAYATPWETFCFDPHAVTGGAWDIMSATLTFAMEFQNGNAAYLIDNIRAR
jgi:hypothetical protein